MPKTRIIQMARLLILDFGNYRLKPIALVEPMTPTILTKTLINRSDFEKNIKEIPNKIIKMTPGIN